MKILVIKQPWAWLIAQGHKRIENRTWPTHYRGKLLIQASKHRTPQLEWNAAVAYARRRGVRSIPETVDQGCIVALVELVACVKQHKSPWFEGPYGFVLLDARPLRPIPCVSGLGLIDAPWEIANEVRRQMRMRPLA